jgi:hypothetical protein
MLLVSCRVMALVVDVLFRCIVCTYMSQRLGLTRQMASDSHDDEALAAAVKTGRRIAGRNTSSSSSP